MTQDRTNRRRCPANLRTLGGPGERIRKHTDDTGGLTVATSAAAPLEETVGDITYIRTDKDLPPVAIIDRSPITTRHKIVFGDHRGARRRRLGDHRVLPRRDGQRGVVRHRRDLHLRHRVPVLRAADRDEDRQAARRRRHARRDLRERHRLHADRPAGAVRAPLRGDRGRRSARRPGAGDADGLPAGHHLDHRRRGLRRLRAGLPGAVDLDAATRPLAGPDGPRRTRRRRRRGRHRRRHRRS